MLCSLSNIDSVEYLAKCVVATIKFPENEPSEDSAVATDHVHLYFLEVVIFFGMIFMMPQRKAMESECYATGSFFINTLQGN